MNFSLTTIKYRKVNESQYKQCRVTSHLFTGENLLKKY